MFPWIVGGLILAFFLVLGARWLDKYFVEQRRKAEEDYREWMAYRIAERQRYREEADALSREPFDPLRQSPLYDRPPR